MARGDRVSYRAWRDRPPPPRRGPHSPGARARAWTATSRALRAVPRPALRCRRRPSRGEGRRIPSVVSTTTAREEFVFVRVHAELLTEERQPREDRSVAFLRASRSIGPLARAGPDGCSVCVRADGTDGKPCAAMMHQNDHERRALPRTSRTRPPGRRRGRARRGVKGKSSLLTGCTRNEHPVWPPGTHGSPAGATGKATPKSRMNSWLPTPAS